jgi:hypothetical protein
VAAASQLAQRPAEVTSLLRRNAPAMRKVGWVVEEGEDLHNNHAIWTVTSPEISRKSDSQDSQDSQGDGHKPCDFWTDGNYCAELNTRRFINGWRCARHAPEAVRP